MLFELANSGWMLASYFDPPSAELLHTIDGGVSWNAIDLPATLDDFCNLSQLKIGAPGELMFLALCYPTRSLYRSSDAGQSWQSSALPANLLPYNDWPQLFMLHTTTGWALGCDTAIKPATCESVGSAVPV